MARYIDADKLIETLKELQQSQSPNLTKTTNEATADVVEVKHGYWINHFNDLFPAESTQECSICHEEEFITLCNEHYCPNCGAKMDAEL